LGWLDLGGIVIVSANEVASIAYKAARGGGLDWGAAEDVAHAARWLARRGLPFAPSLAALLEDREALSPPQSDGSKLAATLPGRPLCPLLAGLFISDYLTGLSLWGGLDVVDVASPLWILPFAAWHAADDVAVTMTWGTGRAAVMSDEASSSVGWDAWPAQMTCRLAVADKQTSVGEFRHHARTTDAGIAVDDDVWRRLSVLEARTYVPASLQSRLTGAGAGVSDND
jgi:hypothetical protein